MKRWIMAGVLATGLAGGTRAAERVFSQTISPAEFAAAGLGKLTAEELRRLDGLVQAHQSGVVARAEAGTKDGKTPPAPAAPAKAKVVLASGTAVEYAAVKSRIVGEFNGWEARTVFGLENGQRWQVASGSTYAGPPVAGPAVEITPGALGTFWMKIEGVRIRVKVIPVGSGK